MASLFGNVETEKVSNISGNLLINSSTSGFSSPEDLIRLLIKHKALDEFIEMTEAVRKEN